MKTNLSHLRRGLPLFALLSLAVIAQAGLPVGATAPDFALPTTKGDTLTLSQFRGQVVILAFWKSN